MAGLGDAYAPTGTVFGDLDRAPAAAWGGLMMTRARLL